MIEAESLSMKFGSVVAAQNISFQVEKGEIMGLLGPNGAGKTTILRMLSTQIVPLSGTAKIAGADIRLAPEKVRKNLGYLPEVAPLYDSMEVGEYIDFVAEGRGLNKGQKKKRMKWVREVCHLGKVWYQPIGQLSKGYRQRVGLAQALIHDPPCLILDEPTSGLDPLQIIEIRKLIKELASTKAIIFSTHILQEVESLADWVTIINEGQIIAQGTFSELAQQASEKSILKIRLDRPWKNLKNFPFEIKELASKEGEFVYQISGPKGKVEASVTHFLCNSGAVLLALERESEDLEQVFLRLIAKKREEAHNGQA